MNHLPVILVTGATGAVGPRLKTHCIKDSHAVYL
jgi:FlaA1/EpsC-like NDP-sugar epimerase